MRYDIENAKEHGSDLEELPALKDCEALLDCLWLRLRHTMVGERTLPISTAWHFGKTHMNCWVEEAVAHWPR